MDKLLIYFYFWLISVLLTCCGFFSLCEAYVGSNGLQHCSQRKSCGEREYDACQAVCCGGRLHHGPGLSCCGQVSFNAQEATCCEVKVKEHGVEAKVTLGLSQSVSSCCGLTAFNSLNEICCASRVVDKPAANAMCCGKGPHDGDVQLCCNEKILQRISRSHECCGMNQFDTETECCCWIEDAFEIHPKGHQCCSQDSGPHDGDVQLCCNEKILQRISSSHECCGMNQFDTETECCCWIEDAFEIHPKGHQCCSQDSGPHDGDVQLCCNEKILQRISSSHECCGMNQFDTETECCCWIEDAFEIHPKGHQCCSQDSGPHDGDVQLCCNEKILQRISSSHECCGMNQFDTETECCCWIEDAFEIHPKGHQCCSQDSGQHDDVRTVSTARTHACCETGMCPLHQRCGDNLYSLAQRNLLSCSNILHTDREDGEECSDSGVPYNPAKGTTCCSKFHGTPGQHCCSADLYQPHREVCCGGHRHPRKPNWGCCGVKMYQIRNKRMKCCAGTLHTLNSDKSADEARCCGSILQNPRDVCCMSEEKQVLYSARTGFACCGHLYFSKSLWSCCSGVLCPLPVPGNPQREQDEDSRLVSLNVLNEQDLCKDIHFGTLESVSLNSLVFRDVMEICVRHATVKPLPLSYILPMPDRCSFPKLTPGKTYFFNETKIFVDFNHESFGESLHFIISKCYHL